VVEAPPLKPDDVFLGHVLVALRDQGRQLLADPERRLLLLQALDRVALENELPVDGGLLAFFHSTHGRTFMGARRGKRDGTRAP
jgi:hypothetical protein